MSPTEVRELGEIFDAMRVQYGRDIAIESLAGRLRRGLKGPVYLREFDPAAATLLEQVFASHGVTTEMVRSHRMLADIRDEGVYLVRRLFPRISFPMLARYLGRDHSSLIVGQQKFAARLAADHGLAARVARLVGDCRAEAVAA